MTDARLTIEDVPYAERDREVLLARVYRSSRAEAEAAAVISVHPGAWHEGDRTWGRLYDEALAQRGFVVVAIDFRQAPRFRHPAASADVATAVRWVRSSPDPLGVDPARVALLGSSSGGHLAMLAACRPNEAEHAGSPLPWKADDSAPTASDAAVRAVAALWAPFDPLTRYRFVLERIEHGPADLRRDCEIIRRGMESYFGDEPTMAQANVARVVRDREATHLPAAWVCYPELDALIPFAIVEELESTWREAGGDITVVIYEGETHAFGHSPAKATDRMLDDLGRFLAEHLGADRKR